MNRTIYKSHEEQIETTNLYTRGTARIKKKPSYDGCNGLCKANNINSASDISL